MPRRLAVSTPEVYIKPYVIFFALVIPFVFPDLFLLLDTVAFASDLVLGTGKNTVTLEVSTLHIISLTTKFLGDDLPLSNGWKVLQPFFLVIHKMFEAVSIPNVKREHVKACVKHTKPEFVLEALARGAQDERDDGSCEAANWSREWPTLPVYAEHDLNWAMALDMLVEQ